MGENKTIKVNPDSRLAKVLEKIAKEKKELHTAIASGKSLKEYKKSRGIKFAKPL